MSRVYARRFALFLLCSGVILYFITSVLISLTAHGYQQKVFGEGKRQPLSIEHQKESQQRRPNSSKNVARSEIFAALTREASFDVTKMTDSPPTETLSEQIIDNDSLSEDCPYLHILSKKGSVVGDGGDIACVPHKASTESCKYATKHFTFNRNLLECQDKASFKFCKSSNQNKPECVFPKFCSTIDIDGINEDNGDYVHIESFKNEKFATEKVRKAFSAVSKSAFKFIFINCRRLNASLHSQQLLPVMLPRILPSFKGHDGFININIVLLDSLSRPHFYRSLPLLIDEFNRINQDMDSYGEVLDFVSFQSLHGHSAENAHALFTGTLLPNNMTEREREKAYVGIGSLYGKFKQAGYTTMYQDDLCWQNFWGMRLELGFPKTWKSMLERIKEVHIDETGLTFANCRMLRSLGLKHPFARTKGDQLCFNGEFQHNYLLEKVLNWHTHSRRPTISYTALNVAHDSSGLRTQTLNRGLIDHVRKSLFARNTITILLADHGNTYTSFVRETLEGRFEMYHPSLFMVIPDPVADLLGKDTMDALRANQNRLLSMLDLNAGLQAIADFSAGRKMPEKRGIFGLIPPERTCDDLQLKLPNLCVCEGWDNVAQNDSRQISVLEFAVGVLNNEIESQRQSGIDLTSEGHSRRIYHRCHHLVPLYFENVRERNWGDSMVTSLDFIVAAGRVAKQSHDVFHVEVKSSILPGTLESYVELLSFDRLSPYEPYRKCTDSGVDARLCVCSLENTQTAKNGVNYLVAKSVKVVTNYMPKLRGLPSKKILFNRKSDKCIYLVARNYHEYSDKGVINNDNIPSAALEAMNICANESFMINVKILPKLMKVSSAKIISKELHANTLTFLCSLVSQEWSWNCRYDFEYSVTRL